jgi:hypothetical protein
MKYEKEIELLIKNVKNIPEEYWEKTDGKTYDVIWFMDRQKPSIEQSYDFDEERFGITRDGKIIWGFDSGCSCPTPWSQDDFGDANYKTSSWKEFKVKPEDAFDADWEDESYRKIEEILKTILLEN